MTTSSAGAAGAVGRPYHHGRLRAELLIAARRTLHDHGVDHVSLRDLARQTGVSHGAPRRHFPDRQALLAALAADGFRQLGDETARAIEDAGSAFGNQFRAVAAAFVRFAVGNTALLDLMYTVGKVEQTAELREATAPLYATFADLVDRGLQAGKLRPGQPERLRLLIIATLQGIAGIAALPTATEQQTEALLDDATALFCDGYGCRSTICCS